MPNFLSDFNMPTINSVQVGMVLSNEILRNIGQEIIETNGEGVTQRFSTELAAGRIIVVRVLPLNQEARSFGADVNGGQFNSNSEEEPSTIQYGLDVLTTIDTPIAIRNATQDMIPVNILEAETANLAILYARNVNAMTIAGKVAKSLGESSQIITVDLSTAGAMREAIQDANTKLDEGSQSDGVDTFPADDRIGVVRPSMRKYILNAVLVGGSNFAQDIVALGGLNVGTQRSDANLRKGFIGVVDGLKFYQANPAIWTLAERYLGFPAGEMADIYGYVSSGMANARGIMLSNTMKVVDAVKGPGILIQPDCRLGFEAFYAKGNVFFAKTGFTAPSVFSTEGVTVKSLAPASRIYPTVALSAQTGTSAPTVTITPEAHRTAEVKQAYYGTALTAKTIQAFDAGFTATAANQKIADLTSGAAATPTASVSAKYLNIKVTDDLGNTTIITSTGTYTFTI